MKSVREMGRGQRFRSGWIGIWVIILTLSGIPAGLWGMGRNQGTAPEKKPVENAAPASTAKADGSPTVQVTLPVGTLIRVRLNQTLQTAKARAGMAFTAALAEPLTAGGRVVAPLGALLQGSVSRVEAPGRFTGGGALSLQLQRLVNPDQQAYPLATQPYVRAGKSSLTRNLGLIAAGAVLGAGVGSMLGQTAGALIGIGVGGGTGAVLSWGAGKTDLVIHAGSELVFTLSRPVVFTILTGSK